MKRVISSLYFYYINKFPINRGKNFIARLLTKIFGSFIVKTQEKNLIQVFLDSQMDCSYFNSDFKRNNLILGEINKLTEGEYFLDIGSNIGYYSLIASKKIGDSGRVYAFEPSNREYKRLLKNIELNKCRNIIPANIALSDSNNEIEFSVAQGHTGLNSIIIGDKSVDKMPQMIKTMRLDTYFDSENREFRLVKIDVEGSEFMVLKGMEKILKNGNISRIIIEITPRFLKCFGYNKNDIYDYLRGYGYKSLLNFDSEQYDELFVLNSDR